MISDVRAAFLNKRADFKQATRSNFEQADFKWAIQALWAIRTSIRAFEQAAAVNTANAANVANAANMANTANVANADNAGNMGNAGNAVNVDNMGNTGNWDTFKSIYVVFLLLHIIF